MQELKQAINKKAEERNSIDYINNYGKYLTDILESPDMQKIWNSYREKYIYANDIELADIIKSIEKILGYKNIQHIMIVMKKPSKGQYTFKGFIYYNLLGL